MNKSDKEFMDRVFGTKLEKPGDWLVKVEASSESDKARRMSPIVNLLYVDYIDGSEVA